MSSWLYFRGEKEDLVPYFWVRTSTNFFFFFGGGVVVRAAAVLRTTIIIKLVNFRQEKLVIFKGKTMGKDN